jgi:hypothetical protein
MPHIRAFARQFEALGAAGESMQVRYHAIGSGDTGAFRVNRLGNLEAITREVIPWGWELTKAGNLNATVLDLSQFRNRAMRGIAERNPALAPFDYDMGKIEADLKTYMENHRQELPGNTKIGDEKRDAINAILGIATTKNRERNALSGSFGPGSAIKQFRLDRVDAAVGTGRTGFHFDYDRANRNFMPDKPAPMPDLSRDLPMPPKPETPGTRVRFGRTGQTYSITNPGLVTLGQAMPEAYHGTPHKVDRFSNENIGAGEGTQVYGWGLYFAENPKVAEDYRNRLVDYSSPGRYSWQGQTWDGSDYKSPERHAVSLAYHQGIPFAKKIAKTGIEDSRLGEPYALEQGGETYYRRMLQVANSIKSKKDIQFSQGNLYTVDLDFDPDHLLDWDKPLRQQSPRVQQALGEIVKQRANITGAQFYRFYSPAYSLAGIAPADLAKQASQHLASLGIPGIRYLDQGSRTTGKGTYNYVVFDESLIKIKAENGQPISTQEFAQAPGQAMPDLVHSTGYNLPKKVPQRGHFLVGAKSAAGHSMEYKVDPKLVVQPPVKDISQYKGERVIVLEADRYDTTNGRMGGPLHPFLISNQVVARTPTGEGYKAAWANMTSTFVSGTRNKVMNNTDNGRALIQLMAEDAHRSNRDFLNNYMAKVDAIKNSLSKQEVDALHVLLELGARQVQESKLPKPQMDFLKAMATAKSQATRGKIDNAKRLFSAAISKYGRTKWFQEISQSMANVSFVAEAANFTFQQRASAIDKVNGMHFLPSVEKDLKASEDFVGAKNLDVVASIQLSRNPDAFAVYFGKNKSEEAKMTNTERNLRDQFLRDPKFKVHPSYDWMMLSPENADNFLLEKPADLETLFPWYRQAHPKNSVRNGTKETVAGAIKRYSGINLKL